MSDSDREPASLPPSQEEDPAVFTVAGQQQHEEPSRALTTIRLDTTSLLSSFSVTETLQSHGIDDTPAITASDSNLHHSLQNINAKYRSPFTWAPSRKVAVLAGAFIAAMLAAYSSGAYALAAGPLQRPWGLSSTAFNVGITVFVTGFGFAPMILAPISEAYGRYRVFVGAGVVFFLGTLGCALTDTYAGMLVARFVTGSGASVFATLVGGVVGDLYHKEERNTPMAIYSLAVMVGTGIGPLVSGPVVDNLGWRWIFWLQVIMVGTVTVCIFFFFDETRSNVVLERKCRALTKLYAELPLRRIKEPEGMADELPRVQVEFRPDIEGQKLSVAIVWRSFAFPFKLLVTESVVFFFSIWVSFAWAILYLQFSSIGIAFKDVYDFSSTEVGAVYVAVVAGSTIITAVSIVQDQVLRKSWPQLMSTPEGRLIPACIQSIFLPAGLFWFGWTARESITWASPALAIASCTMGIFSVYLAVFNYLADTYHRFASSALAAQSMCRNIVAGILPLFAKDMFLTLGYGGAGSLLGGVGFLLTIIPWLLILYGRKIRGRSPFASELLESN